MNTIQYAINVRANYMGNHEYELFFDEPNRISFSMELPSLQDADDLAAKFPKYIKVYASKLTKSGREGVTGILYMDAGLSSNGVRGEVNETGIKRVKAFMKHAAKLGYEFAPHKERAINEVQERRTLEGYLG